MPNQPTAPPLPAQQQLTYADRPEISETFADSLAKVMFDGFNVRMEFVVNRLDDPRPPASPTGKAITACRLVIPISGVMAMLGQLNTLIGTLQAQNVLRPISQPPTSGRPN